MIYLNIKTSEGTETVGELNEKYFNSYKEYRTELKRLINEYKLASNYYAGIYTSQRCTNEWKTNLKDKIMKKYLAFYGEIYYPSIGMGDFIGDFDTLEEAIEHINKTNLDKDKGLWDYHWGSIYDTELKEEVW